MNDASSVYVNISLVEELISFWLNTIIYGIKFTWGYEVQEFEHIEYIRCVMHGKWLYNESMLGGKIVGEWWI